MEKDSELFVKWTVQQVGACDGNIKSRDDKKGLKVLGRNLKNVFNGMEKLRIIHYPKIVPTFCLARSV